MGTEIKAGDTVILLRPETTEDPDGLKSFLTNRKYHVGCPAKVLEVFPTRYETIGLTMFGPTFGNEWIEAMNLDENGDVFRSRVYWPVRWTRKIS